MGQFSYLYVNMLYPLSKENKPEGGSEVSRAVTATMGPEAKSLLLLGSRGVRQTFRAKEAESPFRAERVWLLYWWVGWVEHRAKEDYPLALKSTVWCLLELKGVREGKRG